MISIELPIQSLAGPRAQLSPEEIRNISGLGDVLRQIRARLKSEGISIEDARQKLLENDQDYKIYALQKTK